MMKGTRIDKIVTLLLLPVCLILGLFLVGYSYFGQPIELNNYKYINGTLSEFICSKKKDNEMYYYFILDGDDKYWSYVNDPKWPGCKISDDIFRKIIGHNVEIWLDGKQAVQFKYNDWHFFKVADYLRGHRTRGYQRGAFLIFLGLVAAIYYKIVHRNKKS